jgi:archaellum biogenesis ATPase FlaH
LNTKETCISGEESLIGFIKGLISANYDIKEIFIDGAARMLGVDIPSMGSFISRLDAIAKEFGTEFVLTVSCDKEELPEFFEKYIN